MKIGIMMRAMDKTGGFHAMTHALTREMLQLAPEIDFELLYQRPQWLGTFEHHPNASETLLAVKSKFAWDQLAVPRTARVRQIDVLFNPHFFTPFVAHCPTTMGLQEPAWWTHPEEYGLGTRMYQKAAIPLSIRKCAHIFANSKFILEENRKVLGMPIEHATVTYSAADERFRPIRDEAALDAFREKYALPRRFILVVTRVVHDAQEPAGPLFPGKNPEIAFRAFNRIKDEIDYDLVFAGQRVREYIGQTEGAEANLERVHFLGQMPFEEQHLLYNCAAIFVNPCVYEGCPNTVLQALACGRPTIVAAAGGSADVGTDAALMATPLDDADLATKLRTVALSPELQAKMAADSLRRSQCFSWRKSAETTLDVLTRIAGTAAPG